jgi:hypothetical protein
LSFVTVKKELKARLGAVSHRRAEASNEKPRLRFRAEAFQKGAGNGAREESNYAALVKKGRRLRSDYARTD